MLDLIVVALAVAAAARGMYRGASREVMDLMGLLIAVPVSFRLGGAVGGALFSGWAPLFGRMLGAVVVLGVISLAVEFLGRRMFGHGPTADPVERAGGAVVGLIRGTVFAVLVVIIASGVATDSGLGRLVAESRLARVVAEPNGPILDLFEAASGDSTLVQVVEFNRRFPDGPLTAEGHRALPAADPSQLEPEPGASVELTLLVNSERELAGLQPLDWSSSLTAVAEAYAIEMYEGGFFSHHSPWSGDVGDRLAAAGIDYRVAGGGRESGARPHRRPRPHRSHGQPRPPGQHHGPPVPADRDRRGGRPARAAGGAGVPGVSRLLSPRRR